MTIKNIIIIGSSVSSSVRASMQSLGESEEFDIIASSIANFGSGEPFSELFIDQADKAEENTEKLKNANVIIVQSTADPVGDHCMQLLLTISTAKRYGAKSVTVAMPFAAFARQDRQFDNRFGSVAAEDFPKLLKSAGADQVITAEMHSKAAEGYYIDIFGADNVHFLSTASLIVQQIIEQGISIDDIRIGAPDGADKPNDAGQLRAYIVAKMLCDFSLKNIKPEDIIFKIGKEHVGVSSTRITSFEGDVQDKICIVIDDMADSGGTLKNSAKLLKKKGAKKVIDGIAHGIFTGNGLQSILRERTSTGDDAIDLLIVADTIPEVEEKINQFSQQYPTINDHVQITPIGELFAQKLKELYGQKPQQQKQYKPMLRKKFG